MLSLSRKAEYALIAASHLAKAGDSVVSAREIAARYSVPLPLLMNVLKQLHQRGVLLSVRGARGGYRLARSPQDLTLAQLVDAIDGPLRLVPCVPHAAESDACDISACCPVRSPLNRLHAKLERLLAETTVADLSGDEATAPAVCAESLRVLA